MVTFARARSAHGALAAGWSTGAAIGPSEQLLPGQRLRTPAGSAAVTGTVVDIAQPPRPVRRAR